MRLGTEEIFYLNALNTVSGANARDCIIQGNTISFLVRTEEIGKAIGKNASNLEKLQKKLRKKIEIFEYSANPEEFVKKAFFNIRFNAIETKEEEGKKTVFVSVDAENKSKILNNSSKIKRIKEIAKRNYNIEEIRIK